MIKFKCPHCGKDVSAGDEHAGKKGRCPGCKELFVIPAAAAKPAPAAERRTAPPPADDDAPPKKKKSADYDPDDPEAVEELKKRTGVKVVKRHPDDDDLEVIDETPRKKKPARDDDEDAEAIAEAPRKKKPARDDEDEEDDRPRKKRGRDDDEDDEPRARKKRGRDDDEEEDEDDRPRKKKKRRGKYADCPNCGSRGKATAVGFTWWGGILGPRLFSHVKCDRCGTSYNGKTGDYNTTKIAIYIGVSTLIAVIVLILAILAEQ